jgi:hypothetical protein
MRGQSLEDHLRDLIDDHVNAVTERAARQGLVRSVTR